MCYCLFSRFPNGQKHKHTKIIEQSQSVTFLLFNRNHIFLSDGFSVSALVNTTLLIMSQWALLDMCNGQDTQWMQRTAKNSNNSPHTHSVPVHACTWLPEYCRWQLQILWSTHESELNACFFLLKPFAVYAFSCYPPTKGASSCEAFKGNNAQVQVAESESMQALLDKRQEKGMNLTLSCHWAIEYCYCIVFFLPLP